MIFTKITYPLLNGIQSFYIVFLSYQLHTASLLNLFYYHLLKANAVSNNSSLLNCLHIAYFLDLQYVNLFWEETRTIDYGLSTFFRRPFHQDGGFIINDLHKAA